MKKRKRQGGFTMVEVLVALALTGIAMSGLLAMFGKASASSRYSRRATEATVLAQDQIERLRATGATGSGAQTNIDVNGAPNGLFTRTWTVTENAAYADLVVRVTWDDEGDDRTLTVRSRRNQ
jgi:prepilin-type N-terminal cleavage/methylation domain-containing protein